MRSRGGTRASSGCEIRFSTFIAHSPLTQVLPVSTVYWCYRSVPQVATEVTFFSLVASSDRIRRIPDEPVVPTPPPRLPPPRGRVGRAGHPARALPGSRPRRSPDPVGRLRAHRRGGFGGCVDVRSRSAGRRQAVRTISRFREQLRPLSKRGPPERLD